MQKLRGRHHKKAGGGVDIVDVPNGRACHQFDLVLLRPAGEADRLPVCGGNFIDEFCQRRAQLPAEPAFSDGGGFER